MIRIEPATSDDIHQLTELLSALFTQEADFGPNHAKQARGLGMIIEEPRLGHIFVAREGNEVVGMVNLLFAVSTAEGGFVVLLEDLIVRPSHRGKGTGSALLRHAIDFARTNGFPRITLLTDRINEKAIRFYERHGFQLSAMVPMRLKLDGVSGNAVPGGIRPLNPCK